MSSHSEGNRLDALYVTGGGSELPAVSRMLKEVFGRRVRRSAYTRSATAIGLAIQADTGAGYMLREKFTRHFGVWREAEGGHAVRFDPLFPKGTPLPGAGESPLVAVRTYSPAHNLGHFRYLECSHRDSNEHPSGDIAVWDEIRFPFDPGLQNETELTAATVRRSEDMETQVVEEKYSCDSAGTVTVEIANLTAG